MSILKAASISEFFQDIVDESVRARNVSATDGARTYLVSLLADFAKPRGTGEEALDRPLTFLLDEAMHTPDLGNRFERLRTLGDGVLYTTGFFAGHFESRGVDPEYVIGIGRTAYKNAGSLLRPGSSNDVEQSASEIDLFGELADKFAEFVAVIADVADSTVAKSSGDSKSLLRLYERWLKTRSERLGDALSAQGFVAPRGARVLS